MYQQRRTAVLNKLPENSIAIISGAKLQLRNGDNHYPLRQDSNFYYLTGFDESDAVLILVKEQASSQVILFNQAKNKAQEIWTGFILGQDAAPQVLGIDIAYDIKLLDKKLLVLKKNKQEVDLNNIHSIIAEMRLIKSPEEIACLQRAADISSDAHIKLMQAAPNSSYEYELEAIFTAECIKYGARFMAYPAIVAAGKNACTLHYIENNSAIKEDDLILIDAGCENNYYAADITRTIPASGKFTSQQRDIYEVVLAAQLAGIAQVYPGNGFDKVQAAVVDILVPGLIDLKLLTGSKAQLIKDQAYKKFYMHNSGHWLGLDVHDVGVYKINNVSREFVPGMVLTVEPGLYIEDLNLGIRIEDDILVTDSGNLVLSRKAPKTIMAIEDVMG